jgi:hypothetical protein
MRLPNSHAPEVWDSAQIPGSFLRLFIFLAGRLRRPRPSTGNANRWAEIKDRLGLDVSLMISQKEYFYVRDNLDSSRKHIHCSWSNDMVDW